MFFIKVKNMFFNVFYLQINVINIYGLNQNNMPVVVVTDVSGRGN